MTYSWDNSESFWEYAVLKGQPIFTAPNIATDVCLCYSLPFSKTIINLNVTVSQAQDLYFCELLLASSAPIISGNRSHSGLVS